LVCLYQRYLSSKIWQLFAVFDGIDEHPKNKKKNKIINLFFKNAIFIYKIVN